MGPKDIPDKLLEDIFSVSKEKEKFERQFRQATKKAIVQHIKGPTVLPSPETHPKERSCSFLEAVLRRWRLRVIGGSLALATTAALIMIVFFGNHRTAPTLRDTAGEVRLSATGYPVFAGGQSLPAQVSAQVKELLDAGRVSPLGSVKTVLPNVLGGGGPFRAQEDDSTVPKPLSPMATAIRSTRPTFQWVPVANAKFYVLAIKHELREGNFDSIPVYDGKLGKMPRQRLPSNVADLKRGEMYSWKVKENTEQSSPWVTFYVLDNKALNEVAQMERRFGKSALVLAAVYQSHGLYEDALVQIELLAKRNPDNPQVMRMLDEMKTRDKARR